MKAYAGIGSRQTPVQIQWVMSDIAEVLHADGYILRSGGAAGADDAFYIGIHKACRFTGAQIFLPGDKFNGHRAGGQGLVDATTLPAWPAALLTVERYHPSPGKLSGYARRLMARNAMQVLGPNLDVPAKFVVCWTPRGEVVGGTGQALRIAADHGIPVRNLGIPEVLDKAIDFVSGHRIWQELFQ
jgi:hypothetical protein